MYNISVRLCNRALSLNHILVHLCRTLQFSSFNPLFCLNKQRPSILFTSLLVCLGSMSCVGGCLILILQPSTSLIVQRPSTAGISLSLNPNPFMSCLGRCTLLNFFSLEVHCSLIIFIPTLLIYTFSYTVSDAMLFSPS